MSELILIRVLSNDKSLVNCCFHKVSVQKLTKLSKAYANHFILYRWQDLITLWLNHLLQFAKVF